MTTTDDELIAELRRTFDVVADIVPDDPTEPWHELIHIANSFETASITPIAPGGANTRSHRRRRRIQLVVVMAGVAATLAAALGIVPIASQRGPSAAAALLDNAATVASSKGVLSPSPTQAILDSYRLSIRATETDSSGSKTSSAVFEGGVEEWTLSTGSGHEQVTYGPPQFPSVADKSAWNYNEGIPTSGSISYTTAGPVVSMGPAIGAFDVSRLPTDPQKLAGLLSAPSTGVRGLDGVEGPDLVFHRVALLLSTPLLGSSPAFESALYHVLASISDIQSLGRMASHSGRVGVGFTVSNSSIAIIVDTGSGSLLELRRSNAASADISGGSSIGSEVLQWLDPTGEVLVPASTVPAATPS